MTPGRMSGYLADTHRHELLREARQAALVAEATAGTPGFWTAMLLRVADLLVNAGEQLRAHLAHERPEPAHAGGTLHHADGICQRGGSSCVRIVRLDV